MFVKKIKQYHAAAGETGFHLGKRSVYTNLPSNVQKNHEGHKERKQYT